MYAGATLMSVQLRSGTGPPALYLSAMLAGSAGVAVLQTVTDFITGVGGDRHRAAMSLLCLGARLQVRSSCRSLRLGAAQAAPSLLDMRLRDFIEHAKDSAALADRLHQIVKELLLRILEHWGGNRSVQVDRAQQAYSYAAAALLLAAEALSVAQLQPDCFLNLLLQARFPSLRLRLTPDFGELHTSRYCAHIHVHKGRSKGTLTVVLSREVGERCPEHQSTAKLQDSIAGLCKLRWQ